MRIWFFKLNYHAAHELVNIFCIFNCILPRVIVSVGLLISDKVSIEVGVTANDVLAENSRVFADCQGVPLLFSGEKKRWYENRFYCNTLFVLD